MVKHTLGAGEALSSKSYFFGVALWIFGDIGAETLYVLKDYNSSFSREEKFRKKSRMFSKKLGPKNVFSSSHN